MYRFIVFCFVLACSTQYSKAGEKIILNADHSNSSGVQIAAGGWEEGTLENPDKNADATYIAFKGARNNTVGKYDFYYSLEIVPQFENRQCSKDPDIVGNFLKNVFGTTSGALVVIKSDIQYRWTTGIEVNFLQGDAGLVAAAIGPSATQAMAGNGCYFDETLRPTFPLLQYGGGGPNDKFDDFVIKFIVNGGQVDKLNLVSNVLGLFGDVSAATRWASATNVMAGPVFKGAENGASSFQKALQDAGTYQYQVALTFELKADGNPESDRRLKITLPQLWGDQNSQDQGYMAIYIRRWGSIVLANSDATVMPDTVFDNLALANRQCNPSSIALGTCSTNTDSLRVALTKLLNRIDPALMPQDKGNAGTQANPACPGGSACDQSGANKSSAATTNPIMPLIDVKSASRRALTYNMCKGIRTVARQNLHLSTLDEMLVRWAFAVEGGYLDLKADEFKALANANGVEPKELLEMCWNAGDEKTLEIVADKLKKKPSRVWQPPL